MAVYGSTTSCPRISARQQQAESAEVPQALDVRLRHRCPKRVVTVHRNRRYRSGQPRPGRSRNDMTLDDNAGPAHAEPVSPDEPTTGMRPGSGRMRHRALVTSAAVALTAIAAVTMAHAASAGRRTAPAHGIELRSDGGGSSLAPPARSRQALDPRSFLASERLTRRMRCVARRLTHPVRPRFPACRDVASSNLPSHPARDGSVW
jgi:hypothetical protein